MAETLGLNHLGLAVADLDETTAFFTQVLNWPAKPTSNGVAPTRLWAR